VTLIYSAVQAVALGTLPGVAGSQTPLADSARLFLGGWGGWLMTFGAVVSILGTNSNTVLSGPRYLYALAEDGYGPRPLAYLHPRFRTPVVAILLQSAIALALALGIFKSLGDFASFEGLAKLSVMARLATYLGTAVAVPVLRRKLGATPVRLPGGPVIPIAAALVCIILAASAKLENLIAGAIAILVGLVVYFLRRKPT
jgi:APA family basic amino acid/polyamine antiporter